MPVPHNPASLSGDRDRRERLEPDQSLHARLQELFLSFSSSVAARRGLGPALDTLAREVNALLGTGRVSVWLYRRQTRDLVLAGTSDPAHEAGTASVATSDASPAARGLRLERPLALDGDRLAIAPLKAWRRALGTLVVEGPSETLEPSVVLDLVHVLSRQLASGIENVQLLDEVLRQRRLLEDTFNAIVDSLVVTDQALRIVQVNDACVAWAGTTREALLDLGLAEAVGPAIAAWVSDSTSAGPRRAEFRDTNLRGIVSATVTPLVTVSGDPVGHVLVARDITEHVQAEAEREALRARLGQSEKLASLGQFVAGIAHEMNNPLQGVLGHLELLIARSAGDRELRKDLRGIYHDGRRAARIVRNLLVFTGSQRMVRRRVSIARVLTRVLASRRVSLERLGVVVTRVVDLTLPHVIGDPLLIQQAILNVVINAEHALADRDGPRHLRVEAGRGPGGTVLVTIADNGPGIPEDVLPRIFDPFFTTKDVGKGSGLGLAIAYGIVQEHGGTIRAAEGDDDGGAVFMIELPASGDTVF